MVARIEQRPLDAQGDLGWTQAPGPASEVELTAYTQLLGSTTVYWKGSIAWPRTDLPPNKQYRLALCEYELWETDAQTGDYVTGSSATSKWIKERLVYVDHFALQMSEFPIQG